MEDGGKPPAPIRSTLEDDLEMREAIGRFVIDLGERIDRLQDAEGSADLGTAQLLAAVLSAEADAVGYPALARLAAALEEHLVKCDAEGAHAVLVELTGVAGRIRRGHRGAA